MKADFLNTKDQFTGFDLNASLVEAFDYCFEQFEQFFEGVSTCGDIICEGGESVSPFLRKISIEGPVNGRARLRGPTAARAKCTSARQGASAERNSSAPPCALLTERRRSQQPARAQQHGAVLFHKAPRQLGRNSTAACVSAERPTTSA